MPHEWIDKPKKRRGQTEKEPKTLFREISKKELVELYNRIGFDPEAEHKPQEQQESPQTTIHNVLEEEKPKEDPNTHNYRPQITGSRPKIRDILTNSGIS